MLEERCTICKSGGRCGTLAQLLQQRRVFHPHEIGSLLQTPLREVQSLLYAMLASVTETLLN
jgi:hypothetical protein